MTDEEMTSNLTLMLNSVAKAKFNFS